jgi:hypothetical protein
MALNFGILQPVNIGGQIMAGEQEAQRNQLAQQQLKTGAMQQEKAQMEMTGFKRRQAGLDEFLKLSAANGKTGTPEELADSFYNFSLTQGDPTLIMSAYNARQAAKERSAYQASRTPGAPAAPAIASAQELPGVTVGGPNPPNMLGGAPMPTANRLAPAPVAPAAPVNQLGVDTNAMQTRIDELRIKFPNVPQAQKEADRLEKQLEELNKMQVVAPGATVFRGGKSIFTAPKEVTESEFERNLAKLDLPENQKTAFRIARARKESTFAPAAVVNVSNVQEKAEKAERGKLLVEQYKDVAKAAKNAINTLPALETQSAILDAGFKTGFGTETQKVGASLLSALGVPEATKYAADSEKFLGAANQAILQKQLEQKGTQTASDAERISQTGAQLGNTVKGNRFMIDVATSQLKRDVEQRNFYDAWQKKNDTYDGAEDAWFGGEGGKSLFDRPSLKKYATPVQAPGKPAATQGTSGFKYLGKEGNK